MTTPRLAGETSTSRAWLRAILFVVLAVAVAGALYLAVRLNSNSPVAYDDPKEHFKYGSTGGEIRAGIPYTIWKTLPVIFGLPGGNYQSFGFLYEPGKDLPVGVSKRRYRGMDLVSVNCAICHAGSYRASLSDKPKYVLAMPSNTVDLEAYYQFLFNAAKSEKFTAGRILGQAEQMGIKEDFLNRMILRVYAVNLTRTSLLDFESRLLYMLNNPKFGPGRIDTFGPAKALLNFATDSRMPEAERIGTTDLPSVWYQRQREGLRLHWDGNDTSVQERNRSAAFGTGAYPPTLDRPNMRRIEEFLLDAAPDPYPYAIDQGRAERGKQLYAQMCAYCHGPDGRKFGPRQGALGEVTPIDRIGTDRHRLDSYTLALAVEQSQLYAETKDPSERFSHFRKTNGYANLPLDGVWLRGPYLHNGSVPTLRDLLEKAADRPRTFYRGGDVFDPVKVGFASTEEIAGRKMFLFDTAVPGNGNQGHEGKEYGTELPASDKDALVEYLKTF
jgi:mono/diheme cytochrome c family protein